MLQGKASKQNNNMCHPFSKDWRWLSWGTSIGKQWEDDTMTGMWISLILDSSTAEEYQDQRIKGLVFTQLQRILKNAMKYIQT